MLSERALTALRCSAAVLHCTSGVRLRLAHDGVPLFDITHPPFPEVDHAVLPTCRFRAAVARAHREQLAGHGIAMCGVPEDADPQLSYGVRTDDLVLPGGALRLDRDGMWLHVAAVPASGPHIDELLTACDRDEAATGHDTFQPQVLTDDELDVTVVCFVCAAGDHGGSAWALDALTDATGRVAVAEVEAYLATTAGQPSPRHR